MRFAESQWLWTLIVIPALYAAALWQERKRKEDFARFAHHTVWDAIAPEANWRNRIIKIRLLLAAVAFALLALARPQWGMKEETIRVSGLDIMIALDVSNSMAVEDVIPSRLQKAKHIIRTFVESLRGDRVGVVAFAGSSYVACPLTNDLEYLLESVSLLSPRSVSGQGTDLGVALETARKAMERGAEDPQAAPEGDATRVVILVSDGEDHEGLGAEAAGELARAGARLFVLGVGTEKGGPIPLRDESGNLLGYKKSRSGEPIVSSFQPQSLMKIAQTAGGRYWNVTASESEVHEMLAELNVLERRDYAERTQLIYQDRFQYPLAIAVLLLLLELAVPARKMRTMASSAPVAILAAAMLMSGKASADTRAPLNAYLENQKGLEAFAAGKTEDAKRHFGAAQAHDPDNAALRYNQGLIQLQEGDLENGMKALDSAAQNAAKSGNPALVGQARFNQGAALSKAGNIPGAIQAYLEAIEAAKTAQDEALEKDARKNIELLARQQEQKKKEQKKEDEQQQKQDQEQQKQENEKNEKSEKNEQKEKEDSEAQKKDKDSEKDKKDESEESKDTEPKQFSETSKETRQRQFKSAKLSDEDAERVMAELKSRERELQKRLKKQNGNQQRNGKDW